MADRHPGLNERQHMLLSHLVTSGLREPDKLINAMKDPKGTLKALGASEEDVAAIQAHVKHLEGKLKSSGNVGAW